MKVGVIGSNSFLAKNLIKKIFLENKVEKLVLFTSSLNREYKNKSNVEYLIYKYPEKKLKIEDLICLDIIYFCSALGLEKNSKVSDNQIMGINTFEPINLSNLLEKNNYKGKFITFGSYFEIGRCSKKYKFSELEIAFSNRPLFNTYCLSKRLLTNYFCSKEITIDWYHFLLPNFYGNGEKQIRLIPYLINSISKGKVLKVTEGNQIRQYLHVSDIVSLLYKLIYNDFTPSIYNLVPDECHSVKEVISIAVNIFGSNDSKFEKIERYDENMPIVYADNSKLKNEFSWNPKISIEEGIKNYFKI